jgi:hypothetical protein
MTSKLILFTLFAFLIAALFSCLILTKAPDQIWSWWIGLTSTLVSVFLGISIAIGIFFFQKSVTQKQDKEKFLFLLDTELSATWQGLQTVDNPLNIKINEKTFSFHVVFLQQIVLEEAARTGLFDKTETRVLLKLARWISFHNMNLNLLINSIPNLTNDSLSEQKMNMIGKSHKGTRENLIKDIMGLHQVFQLETLKERIKLFPLQKV